VDKVSARALAVVMAGGSGTRFFPLSRKHLPKQFLSLFGGQSLLAESIDRMEPVVGPGNVFVVSAESQAELLAKHVGRDVGLFLEPAARNTAPCLMWTLLGLRELRRDPNEVLVAVPADHYVRDEARFQALLRQAIAFASEQKVIVTLGITPTSPHTGYGYIAAGEKWVGDFSRVVSFIEKPDAMKAAELFASKNFFWNAGIFVGTLSAFEAAFERHMTTAWRTLSGSEPGERARHYLALKSEPVDTAVMEKERALAVLPTGDIGWSDVGSWNALYELRAGSPGESVVLEGTLEALQSSGCLVSAPGKKVALLGVKDLIIVDTGDCLLVANREQDQKVRAIAEKLDP